MYTLGYSFRPWMGEDAIAEGGKILNYLRETAAELGIESRIRLRHSVKRAQFSSNTALWTVEAENEASGVTLCFTCNFLFCCTGYYDYAAGYLPQFPGSADFSGRIVHPQHWPATLDYAGKQVVVIGSGATAVTLVPALARTAARVTMLQRSPTYIVAMPTEDGL